MLPLFLVLDDDVLKQDAFDATGVGAIHVVGHPVIAENMLREFDHNVVSLFTGIIAEAG